MCDIMCDVTWLGEWYFFDQKQSSVVVASFAIMVIGAMLAGAADLQFSLEVTGGCLNTGCLNTGWNAVGTWVERRARRDVSGVGRRNTRIGGGSPTNHNTCQGRTHVTAPERPNRPKLSGTTRPPPPPPPQLAAAANTTAARPRAGGVGCPHATARSLVTR